jgi:hypothetical protein
MKAGLILGLVGLLLGGCVAPPVNYYYGAYSRSLYRSKKDSTPESLAKHRDVLLDIIRTSERRGIKVPPGIYFEYGYLLAKEGSPEAERYFGMEVKAYPEAERFVSFVRAQLQGKS